MLGAITQALERVLAGVPARPGAMRAAAAIADAVVAHAVSFAPAPEPPYHDQYHQAEATFAMGLLCTAARDLVLIDATEAAAGVLAMAGHDLLHDGSPAPAGVLEAISAKRACALAAAAGMDYAHVAIIRRVILATATDLVPEAPCDDLLSRLAQEADLFASLTPNLGWRLGQALAREWRSADYAPAWRPDTFAGRLHLLRTLRPMTKAGQQLGLAAAVADQTAAFALLGDGDADRGAALLDTLPPGVACARFAASLARCALR